MRTKMLVIAEAALAVTSIEGIGGMIGVVGNAIGQSTNLISNLAQLAVAIGALVKWFWPKKKREEQPDSGSPSNPT